MAYIPVIIMVLGTLIVCIAGWFFTQWSWERNYDKWYGKGAYKRDTAKCKEQYHG